MSHSITQATLGGKVHDVITPEAWRMAGQGFIISTAGAATGTGMATFPQADADDVRTLPM